MPALDANVVLLVAHQVNMSDCVVILQGESVSSRGGDRQVLLWQIGEEFDGTDLLAAGRINGGRGGRAGRGGQRGRRGGQRGQTGSRPALGNLSG
jgi:hypothetical protein